MEPTLPALLGVTTLQPNETVIDMDERKNNLSVEKRIKDKLKTDRARIQVGRISGFGLMEMSRQRLRPGMIEATTQGCPHCHGTGLIRSDDNLALAILRQVEEEGVRRRSREVVVTCPVGIANFLMNPGEGQAEEGVEATSAGACILWTLRQLLLSRPNLACNCTKHVCSTAILSFREKSSFTKRKY